MGSISSGLIGGKDMQACGCGILRNEVMRNNAILGCISIFNIAISGEAEEDRGRG